MTSKLKKANWFSQIFYLWISTLFSKARVKKLEENDLYDLSDEDSAIVLTNKLQSEWNRELAKKSPSLFLAICRAFGWRYLCFGCYLFVFEAIKIANPVLVALLVDCFSEITMSSTIRIDAYFYATIIVILNIIFAVTQNMYYFCAHRMSMWVKVACSGLVYRKILSLNQETFAQVTSGRIVNLLTNDIERFRNIVVNLNYIWVLPIQTIVVFVLLWQQLGLASLAGFFVFILFIPLQVCFGRLIGFLREQTAVITDERVKFLSEIISSMRLIKLYCWEKFFEHRIDQLRRLELRWIQSSILSKMLSQTPFFWYSKLTIVVMLMVAYLQNMSYFIHAMNLSTIFLIIGLVKYIRGAAGIFIPYLVMYGAESRISIQRLQEFLLLHEVDMNQDAGNVDKRLNKNVDLNKESSLIQPMLCGVEKKHVIANRIVIHRKKHEKHGLIVENIFSAWNPFNEDYKSPLHFTLKNINFSVGHNELVIIVGPVGAGKSSLLMSLLGELRIHCGRIEIEGKLGYVAQQPWVFGDTLRNNILFGKPLDEERYYETLYCSALLEDLTRLRSGDQTLIGERGVILSGGQRARVSLARAVYQDADVYLLDDTLSAVDATIGKILFQRCILGALANKPRILVTHNVHFARYADKILVFKDGCITAQGTFKELQSNGIDVIQLFHHNDDNQRKVKNLEKTFTEILEKDDVDKRSDILNEETIDLVSKQELKYSPTLLNSDEFQFVFNSEEEELDEEERYSGKITLSTYHQYFQAGNFPLCHLIPVLLYCGIQGLSVYTDWYLLEVARIISNYTSSNRTNFASSQHYKETTKNYFFEYSALILSLIIAPIIFDFVFTTIVTNASRALHNRAFSRLLRVPMLFYDTNPAGRVLNRFSKDIGAIDDFLPDTISEMLDGMILTLSAVFMATFISFWSVLVTFPLCAVFIYIRNYYLPASRDISRIENTARSPVLSHISNTLLGLTSLRAMQFETQFTTTFFNLMDRHSSAYIMSRACIGWLGVRLDLLCVMFIITVTYSSVLVATQINGALVGLCLSYSFDLLDIFEWCIQKSNDLEIQMIAVERILEYTQLVQEEVSDIAVEQFEDWPRSGSIQFQDVSFRYSVEQPIVLHQINFKINEMEKIGIVGRTGSGKSSLFATLFRLAEIESDGGCILVDNVSTRNIPLSVLRRKLSVIPQDPVLFSGTIRQNLDPNETCEDAEIYQALNDVQLGETINVFHNGLDTRVVEGGHNFSVGQRQLLCLARALLGSNRILVIDEATANVDPHTDALIQVTLRKHFAQSTVLTIAHRLNTVVNSDRLLVLDKGRVVQFDHPHRLLEAKIGFFYDLVQSLGSDEINAFEAEARRSFEQRNISNIS